MLSIAVCTAHVGQPEDELRPPALVADGVRYLCASDHDVAPPWVRVPVTPEPDPVRAARRFKALLHEHTDGFDVTVWHDAAFALEVDPQTFLPPLKAADILVMPHPFCATLEEEAAELERRCLADPLLLAQQRRLYEDQHGFPRKAPHSSTGLLVRRNDARTIGFNQAWAAELARFDHARDQMSFDFVAWRLGLRVHYLEGEYRENPWATWRAAA